MTIPSQLRKRVMTRARNRCEYCLLPQAFALHKHEPDHVIAQQHDGETSFENLALACMRCNRHKGSNVGSFDPLTDILTPSSIHVLKNGLTILNGAVRSFSR